MSQKAFDETYQYLQTEHFIRGLFKDEYLTRAPQADASQIQPDKVLGTFHAIPSTDLDAGRFIKRVLSPYLKFIPTNTTSGEWYIWDMSIWRKDSSGQLAIRIVDAFTDATGEFAGALAKHIPDPNPEIKGKTPLEKAYEAVVSYNMFLKSERNAAGLRKRISTALGAEATHFDNDRGFIVFADGAVLDTANPSADLMEADHNRPVSRKLGVNLGEGTPTRLFKAFQDWEIPADQQRYLQIAAGAALLGRGDAKNIAALVGVSNTGKSSFIRTLLKAFGSYGGILPAGAIVAKTSTNFEQYKARGIRFLYLEEPYEARTDDSFLKNLAGGGGEVPTQQKGRDVVEWIPQCVLFIGANHVPKINTQDDAIVKRMNIVGFNRVFAAGDNVFHKNIEAWLIEQEGAQIARWIVDGAIEYNRLGFIPVPDSIRDNATANSTKSSVSLRWLTEQFETNELVNVKGQDVAHRNMIPESKELYNQFSIWCMDAGEKVPSKKSWADEINRFQGQPVVNDGKRSGGSKRLWGVMDPSQAKTVTGLNSQKLDFRVTDGVATLN